MTRHGSLLVRTVSIVTLGLAVLALSACASGQKTTPRSAGSAGGPDLGNVLGERVGDSLTTAARAAVQKRGPVPYDDQTLPLVSPDGRLVATQVGELIVWDVLTARRNRSIPETSRIEVYDLGDEANASPVLMFVVEEPVLLGRSVNSSGFVVESPRDDGSRWIGLVPWSGGPVQWLVREDDTVCAFASLGPDDRLAYSRRPVNGTRWDLAIEHRGASWTLPADGGDWLMPTWSGVNAGLFVLQLRAGKLDALHMDATDRNSVRRSLWRIPLAGEGATLATAYQTIGPHVSMIAGPTPARERLFFYHPTWLCAAVWDPFGKMFLLDEHSICGAVDSLDTNHVLVTLPTDLVRRLPGSPRAKIKLIAGMQIPRRTAAEQRPYILLQPAERMVGITIMGLLPPEDQ